MCVYPCLQSLRACVHVCAISRLCFGVEFIAFACVYLCVCVPVLVDLRFAFFKYNLEVDGVARMPAAVRSRHGLILSFCVMITCYYCTIKPTFCNRAYICTDVLSSARVCVYIFTGAFL